MIKKNIPAGRQAGTANKKSKYLRNCTVQARVTEGAHNIIHLLMTESRYKTPSDVLHDAIETLGRNKLASNKKNNYWLKRIQ